MSLLLPALVIGAVLGMTLGGEVSSVQAATPPAVAAEHATLPGVGSYLKGAVADLDGRPTVALQGYLSALAEDPDNASLRQRTFELALMAGDLPNAIRLAHTLPQLEQTTMTRLVTMAALTHDGKVEDARKIARQIAKVSPELLQFRLMQVYLDYGHGSNVDKLVEELDAKPVPPSMQGRKDYHVARLLLKAGEPERALEMLKHAAQVEPGSVATTLLLGETLARQGDPGAGAAVYDAFRAANPSLAAMVPVGKSLIATVPPAFASTLDEDMAAVLSDFGLLIWAQGAYGPARQLMNLSLWLDPTDPLARYFTGMLLEMGGDVASAQVHYAYLLQTQGPEGLVLAAEIRLAEMQFLEGQQDAAWARLRKLVKTHGDEPNLRRSLAQMAFSRGDYSEAIDNYTALLGVMPDTTPPSVRMEVLFARAVAYERDEEIEAAADDMQAALAIDPANAQVLNYLGYMWVDRGMHIPQAFDMLQRAHTLAPDDGAITDSIGWAYYRRGDFARAVAYLERAVEQEPESPEIYDHLGDAYAGAGRRDDARREWRRALDLLAEGKEGPDEGFGKRVQRKLR